jgi:hypothetical protein
MAHNGAYPDMKEINEQKGAEDKEYWKQQRKRTYLQFKP